VRLRPLKFRLRHYSLFPLFGSFIRAGYTHPDIITHIYRTGDACVAPTYFLALLMISSAAAFGTSS
jgi:hypothetical protein